MAVLAAPVALHDPECTGRPCLGATYCLLDAEAFVQATLNASKRMYGPDEREDLVADGLRILIELHGAFEPRREGYGQRGRLPGYAAKYLRLKLEDAYHRQHPEHRLVTQPDGKRRYAYGERAVSLEALVGEDPDREPLLADVATLDAATVARRLHEAMWERWAARVKLWSEVAELLAQDATDSEVAEILGMTGDQVKQAKAAIAEAMPRAIGGDRA